MRCNPSCAHHCASYVYCYGFEVVDFGGDGDTDEDENEDDHSPPWTACIGALQQRPQVESTTLANESWMRLRLAAR